MTELNLVVWGEGEPVILVHGSMSWGTKTFAEQKPLSDKYRLILIDRRGYGASPFTARADFEQDAEDIVDLLEGGAHLVGQSYGGVACLVAAGMQPDKVRSLTVIEPPALGLVRGNPAVEQFIARLEHACTLSDPIEFFFNFIEHPENEPRPEMKFTEQEIAAIRTTMHERSPWEAEIKLDTLAAARFPKLVASGARLHLPEARRKSSRALAFGAVCDLLTERLAVQRAIFDKAAHSPQKEMPQLFNLRLRAFLEDAAAVGT